MPTQSKQTQQASEQTKTVNRNFALPVEQAEWLRVTAFHENRPQSQLFRESIAALIKKYDRGTTPPANPVGVAFDKTVNRNFAMPVEQAEWLRVAALSRIGRSLQLTREAIADAIKRYAKRTKTKS